MANENYQGHIQFIESFRPVHLYYREPDEFMDVWVFWADIPNAPRTDVIIREKLISAFSLTDAWGGGAVIVQFRRLEANGAFSFIGQPYSTNLFGDECVAYRKYCENTVLLDQLPSVSRIHWNSGADSSVYNILISIPVCLASSQSCIGVVDITADKRFSMEGVFSVWSHVQKMINNLKKVDVNVLSVQDIVGCKVNIDAAKKMKYGTQFLCQLHDISLAQIWTTTKAAETEKIIAHKVAGYINGTPGDGYTSYSDLCDIFPMTGYYDEPVWKTFQDYESRHILMLHPEVLEDLGFAESSFENVVTVYSVSEAFGIKCVFELMGLKDLDESLDAILLTLKTCFHEFVFLLASDDVNVVEGEKESVSEKEKGKQVARVAGVPTWPGPAYMKTMNLTDPSITAQIVEEENKKEITNQVNIEEYIMVKVFYKLTVRIRLYMPVTYDALVAEIAQRFVLEAGSYMLKYLDEDGDWIILANDADMELSTRVSRKPDGSVLVRVRMEDQTRNSEIGI